MNTSGVLASRLEQTLAGELPHLRAILDGPATSAPNRPSGVGWSQREELGHLIDSAVNNHIRIVRAALESSYQGPSYDQKGWVAVHRYLETPWGELLETWLVHNRILVSLIGGIPDAKLATPCIVGHAAPVTLDFLIDDYVVHMRHHLDNILRREVVTPYPRS